MSEDTKFKFVVSGKLGEVKVEVERLADEKFGISQLKHMSDGIDYTEYHVLEGNESFSQWLDDILHILSKEVGFEAYPE